MNDGGWVTSPVASVNFPLREGYSGILFCPPLFVAMRKCFKLSLGLQLEIVPVWKNGRDNRALLEVEMESGNAKIPWSWAKDYYLDYNQNTGVTVYLENDVVPFNVTISGDLAGSVSSIEVVPYDDKQYHKVVSMYAPSQIEKD